LPCRLWLHTPLLLVAMVPRVQTVLCLCVLLVAAIACGTDGVRMPAAVAAAVATPPSLRGAPVSAPTK